MKNTEALKFLFEAAQAGASFEEAVMSIRDSELVTSNSELVALTTNPESMLKELLEYVGNCKFTSIDELASIQSFAIQEVLEWMEVYREITFEDILPLTEDVFQRAAITGYWMAAVELSAQRDADVTLVHVLEPEPLLDESDFEEYTMSPDDLDDLEDAPPVPVHTRGHNPHVMYIDEATAGDGLNLSSFFTTAKTNEVNGTVKQVDEIKAVFSSTDVKVEDRNVLPTMQVAETTLTPAVSSSRVEVEEVPVESDMEKIKWFVDGEELAKWRNEVYDPATHGVWKNGELLVFPTSIVELQMTDEMTELERIEADKVRVKWLIANHARRHADVGLYFPPLYAWMENEVEWIRVPKSILTRQYLLSAGRHKYRKELEVKRYENRSRQEKAEEVVTTHEEPTEAVEPVKETQVLRTNPARELAWKKDRSYDRELTR